MEGLDRHSVSRSKRYENDINVFFVRKTYSVPQSGDRMRTRTAHRQGSNIVLDCRMPVRPARALLCDISDTGCRIEVFDGHALKGSTIFFEIDGRAEFAGQIVWVRGTEAGVRFMHRLSPLVRDYLEL